MPSTPITDSNRSLRLGWLDALMLLAGLTALGCLLAQVGWHLSDKATQVCGVLTRAVLGLFVIQELMRLIGRKPLIGYLKKHWLELLMALIAGTLLLLESVILSWARGTLPELKLEQITLFYLAASQGILIVALFLRALRFNTLLQNRRVPPGILLIVSFGLTITAGMFLLKMPKATTEGISWVDALFTSTSAVCVTGLIVVDTATAFTMTGKTIILGLIQVGGLGVMTLTYFFALVFAQGLSLRDRVMIGELISEDNVRQITTLLFSIVVTVFVIEAIGAWVIYAALVDAGLPKEGLIFISVFHSISAFCNAGFSTYTAGLADPLLEQIWGLKMVIMLLIILGGLGFPILKELGVWLVMSVRRLWQGDGPRPRFSPYTRLALTTTLFLILAGWVVVYCSEQLAQAQDPEAGEPLNALFWSVTARTAGFNTTATELLTPASALFIIMLMFVGGCPASTAGGIKTTVFAVAFLNTLKILKERTSLEVFSRSVPDTVANRAFAIIILGSTWVLGVSIILMALNPNLQPLDLIFEAVSAFATVGLSRAVTFEVGDASRLLLVLTMFVGRVGVLLFVVSFFKPEPHGRIRLPETNILLN